MKKQIPNLITLCNLLCGVCACINAVRGDIAIAAIFISAGIFFDFFDGLAARALGVASPIGKELDSLADVVTSGVAPGLIIYTFFDLYCGNPLLSGIALLIPLFSAYRLAKFNLDTRQTHSFLGLPTPANALVWGGLAIWFQWPQLALIDWGLDNNFITLSYHAIPLWIFIALAILSLLLDILLISELPLFALKIKNLSWKDNRLRYLFILSSLALIILFGGLGISLTILWYILLSILTRQKPEQA